MSKLLTEKFVQDSIIEYLFRKGWSRNLRSKTTEEHGVDIKVRNNKFSRYWLIECKGDASKNAKYQRSHREVCFNLAFGQIITRMNHGGTTRTYFGLGLPTVSANIAIRRIPWQVAKKLLLYVFSVDKDGKVKLYDWKKIRTLQR